MMLCCLDGVARFTWASQSKLFSEQANQVDSACSFEILGWNISMDFQNLELEIAETRRARNTLIIRGVLDMAPPEQTWGGWTHWSTAKVRWNQNLFCCHTNEYCRRLIWNDFTFSRPWKEYIMLKGYQAWSGSKTHSITNSRARFWYNLSPTQNALLPYKIRRRNDPGSYRILCSWSITSHLKTMRGIEKTEMQCISPTIGNRFDPISDSRHRSVTAL